MRRMAETPRLEVDNRSMVEILETRLWVEIKSVFEEICCAVSAASNAMRVGTVKAVVVSMSECFPAKSCMC